MTLQVSATIKQTTILLLLFTHLSLATLFCNDTNCEINCTEYQPQLPKSANWSELPHYIYSPSNFIIQCERINRGETIYAVNVSSLTLTCDGCGGNIIYCPPETCTINCYGCSQLEIHADFTNVLSITAFRDASFVGNDVYISNANTVDITCWNIKYLRKASCSNNTYIMNNKNTKVSFECYGTGCKQLGLFDVPTFGENIDINIHSCINIGYECVSKYDCLGDFALDCNYDNLSSTFEFDPLFCSSKNRNLIDNITDFCGCYMSATINFENTCQKNYSGYFGHGKDVTGLFGEEVGNTMNDNKYIIIGIVSVVALLLLAMNICIYLKTVKSDSSCETVRSEIQLAHMRSGSTSSPGSSGSPANTTINGQITSNLEFELNKKSDTAHSCFRRLLFMDNFIWLFMTCLTIYDLYTDFTLSIAWFTFEEQFICITGCITEVQQSRQGMHGEFSAMAAEFGVILFITSLVGFVVATTTKIIELILLIKVFHLRKYIDWNVNLSDNDEYLLLRIKTFKFQLWWNWIPFFFEDIISIILTAYVSWTSQVYLTSAKYGVIMAQSFITSCVSLLLTWANTLRKIWKYRKRNGETTIGCCHCCCWSCCCGLMLLILIPSGIFALFFSLTLISDVAAFHRYNYLSLNMTTINNEYTNVGYCHAVPRDFELYQDHDPTKQSFEAENTFETSVIQTPEFVIPNCDGNLFEFKAECAAPINGHINSDNRALDCILYWYMDLDTDSNICSEWIRTDVGTCSFEVPINSCSDLDICQESFEQGSAQISICWKECDV